MLYYLKSLFKKPDPIPPKQHLRHCKRPSSFFYKVLSILQSFLEDPVLCQVDGDVESQVLTAISRAIALGLIWKKPSGKYQIVINSAAVQQIPPSKKRNDKIYALKSIFVRNATSIRVSKSSSSSIRYKSNTLTKTSCSATTETWECLYESKSNKSKQKNHVIECNNSENYPSDLVLPETEEYRYESQHPMMIENRTSNIESNKGLICKHKISKSKSDEIMIKKMRNG
ncbi:hypothetical protein FQR65_LT01097 [Abscondita terminalis]|nr:hypothetical protein FQR65_LT01097 [Abscondita terminalis]